MDFPGHVSTSYRESQPWLEPVVRPPPGAPNVVIVVLDDVGFAQLGCYGSTLQTPRLDALARGGRRYNNFHTTAMCSPTRAALLTGRNHHAVGMGMISDWCTGYPGYRGEIAPEAGTLAEVLQAHGYSCLAIGKWHLARVRDWSAAGPFAQWPLGRGFDRYYGFLTSLSDHWNPELISDNHAIPTPRRPGYHLTEDLVDQTIQMVRAQQAVAPEQPFFAYLALGACHSPHQAPQPHIARYAGSFDEGWDVMRQRWFERQLQLGVVPAATQLTPRHEAVRAWSKLSVDEQRLCARHQEVFAGFLSHADEQIGRLVDALQTQGVLDNTLLVVLSDNGATEEGGDWGDANIRCHYQFIDEPFAHKLAQIDQLGTAHSWSNYPRGWGHAGNTPLRRYKMHTHGGGVRDPLIVHWPARIRQGGLVSPQFCHCNDIVPTVLEAIGITPPQQLKGVAQLPLHGSSLLYTFDEPQAPTRKAVQYFELMGNRGLWAKGWKAVTEHHKGDDFDADRWELYHLDSDFAESRDLAAEEPDKLSELIGLWWQEAKKHLVLPLDDRSGERGALTYHVATRQRYVYQPGGGRISGAAAPPLADRSWRLTADVTLQAHTEGVVFAAGNRFGGWVLYLVDSRLVFEYAGPQRRWLLRSMQALPVGRIELAFTFRKTAACAGIGTLLCNGTAIGELAMHGLWPYAPNAGGLYCGLDDGCPASEHYTLPFAFTGSIHSVVVEPGSHEALDGQAELQVLLNED